MEAGRWTPALPGLTRRMLDYVRQLEANGRYPLCIWPPHCLIGSPGHKVMPELRAALQRWEERCFAMVDYLTKGSNPWTEHYSAVAADVPDEDYLPFNSGAVARIALAERRVQLVTGFGSGSGS